MDETSELGQGGEGGEPAGTRPAAPRKQGETPSQQIRKAKLVGRRAYSAEEKIRIVLEGMRDISASEPRRREGIHPNMYHESMKDFVEGGKSRLRGDVHREANREEVASLKEENDRRDPASGGGHRRDCGAPGCSGRCC